MYLYFYICLYVFKGEKGEPVVNILSSRPLVIPEAASKIGGIGEVVLVSYSVQFSNLR